MHQWRIVKVFARAEPIENEPRNCDRQAPPPEKAPSLGLMQDAFDRLVRASVVDLDVLQAALASASNVEADEEEVALRKFWNKCKNGIPGACFPELNVNYRACTYTPTGTKPHSMGAFMWEEQCTPLRLSLACSAPRARGLAVDEEVAVNVSLWITVARVRAIGKEMKSRSKSIRRAR